ncbi:DUF2490 domain-containing protein [bacterium]|nr:MAG: DUF2490 domain-containing protein [bacterium]
MVFNISIIRQQLLVLAFAIFGLHRITFAQQSGVHQQRTWTQFYINTALTGSLYSYSDFGFRFDDGFSNHYQSFLRTALGYRLSNNGRLGIGYAYFNNDDNTGYEHRIFQDGNLQNKWGEIELKHRLRIEERFFFGNKDLQHLRVRYQIAYRPKWFSKDGYTLFGDFSDELMFAFGSQTASHHIDQNRVYSGLKVETNYSSVLMGYQFTCIPGLKKSNSIIDHIVRVGLAIKI